MAADVGVEGVRKAYGDVVAVDDVDLDGRRRRVLHPARPIGLGEDDDAAHDRRVRAARRRARSALGGEDITRPPALRARRQHRLPGLRALPAHDRGRERRLRPAREGCRARRARGRRSPRCWRRCGSTGYGDRKPVQLSGGQRQRVALARAIVNRPKVLLLDEPLGALDLKLRQEMQLFLKALQRDLGMTFIYVTHDQEEALTMSDQVAVFNEGRIEQVGTPARCTSGRRPSSSPASSAPRTSSSAAAAALCVRPERISFAGDGEPATIDGRRVRRRVHALPRRRPSAGERLTVVQQNDRPRAPARRTGRSSPGATRTLSATQENQPPDRRSDDEAHVGAGRAARGRRSRFRPPA